MCVRVYVCVSTQRRKEHENTSIRCLIYNLFSMNTACVCEGCVFVCVYICMCECVPCKYVMDFEAVCNAIKYER